MTHFLVRGVDLQAWHTMVKHASISQTAGEYQIARLSTVYHAEVDHNRQV